MDLAVQLHHEKPRGIDHIFPAKCERLCTEMSVQEWRAYDREMSEKRNRGGASITIRGHCLRARGQLRGCKWSRKHSDRTMFLHCNVFLSEQHDGRAFLETSVSGAVIESNSYLKVVRK